MTLGDTRMAIQEMAKRDGQAETGSSSARERRSPRRPVRAALLVAALAWLGAQFAVAQPFAAAGGFGEPREVVSEVLPVVAVASGDGESVTVWADARGVHATPMAGGDGTLVAESASVRGVWATIAGEGLAVAWNERDRSTGRVRHWLTYAGEDHLLFTSPQETQLSIGRGAEGPWVAAPLRQAGEARLSVYAWHDGAPAEPRVEYATELSVRGMYALDVPDDGATGPSWIAWLEGFTEMTAVGLNSEWHAYVMALREGAVPLDLGLADVVDERQTVALGHVDGTPDAVRALWRPEEETLEAALVVAVDDGHQVAERVDLGEVGRPIAWVGDAAYWLEGAFIRRAEPLTSAEEPLSVAWSPELVAEASVSAGEVSGSGVVSIGWYGRRQGGAVVVFAADDTEPFTPGLTDRIAAFMGWNPYVVWEEAAGQALTAVIVGMMASLAVAPVLFLVSVAVARFEAVRAQPVMVGAVLGLFVPPLLVLLLASRVPALDLLRPGPLVGLVASLAVGTAIGYLASRGADREAQLDVLVTSAVTVLVGLTIWSFVNYRSWAPFVGL